MTLNAVIYRDESGVYCAEIPSLPGCCSDGDTFEQATANIREAAEGWLAAQEGTQRTIMRTAGLEDADL